MKAKGAIRSERMAACATSAWKALTAACGGAGGAGGGCAAASWQIALQTSRRPPVSTFPASAGTLSTWERMSAFTSPTDNHGWEERMSAAAPETCAAAIEPPLR